MGCDINTAIQIKRSDDKWSTIELPSSIIDKLEKRNYVLFAILANVRPRYNIKPISECKGFPDDQDEINERSFFVDVHSSSYHTLKVLKEYDWNHKIDYQDTNCTYKEVCSTFYNCMTNELQELSDKYGGDENIRLIFCFDS